jgi:hypothetical protein
VVVFAASAAILQTVNEILPSPSSDAQAVVAGNAPVTTTEQPRSGKHAFRHEANATHPTSEIIGHAATNGGEYWYGGSFRFPAGVRIPPQTTVLRLTRPEGSRTVQLACGKGQSRKLMADR